MGKYLYKRTFKIYYQMKKIIFLLMLLCVCPVWAENYETISNIIYHEGVNSTPESPCDLDLYYPKDKKGFATVVWFHGGGLTSGRKYIPDELKESGLAIVAVDYRLMPKVTLSDCIDDAAAAVAWTFNNIEKYGGRRDRIIVSGHSAGGYLTNMVGLDKKWMKKYELDPDSIALLVPFSGHAISHFAYRKAKGMSVKQPSIDEFAPLYYVRGNASPIVIVSGDRNMEIYGRYEETAYFWRMLKENGHKHAFLYELDGYNHSDMVRPGFHILKNHVKKLK